MSRRARVTPEQAGLYVLDGDARRVPGLRREEVATLAGLGALVLTALRSSRPPTVSVSEPVYRTPVASATE